MLVLRRAGVRCEGRRCFLRIGKEERREVRIERESRAGLRVKRTNCKKQLSVLRNGELQQYDGEFDPGSERTLAARIKHASRTGVRLFGAS